MTMDGPPSPVRRFRLLAGPVAVAAVLLAVAAVHVWILSAGRMTQLTSQPDYGTRYDFLADAFLHGQTYLLIRPSPELLALPDPYDPEANNKCRVADALLYQGRYYLYWGPAPAVFLAAFKYVTGVAAVRDEPIALVFLLGTVGFGTLLLLEVRRQFMPRLAWGMVVPGVLVLGLGNPLPFMLAPAGIYQAAILGGQCFLLAGLYGAVRAFRNPHAAGTACLAAAGLCWSLAVHSRLSLGPAVAVLALLVAWRVCRVSWAAGTLRRAILPVGALGVPLAVALVLLALYNYVRFGSVTEFGVRYQLAGIRMPSMIGLTSGLGYFLPNVSRYLFYPPQLQDAFPFVFAPFSRDPVGLPGTEIIPYLSYREPVAGVLWTSPFALLALIPLLALVRNLVARRPAPGGTAEAIGMGWVALLLACGGALGFAPTLFVLGNGMRYLGDLAPSLSLLATLGLWQVHQLLAPRRWLALAWLGLTGPLAAATVLCGVLLGVTGYYGHFRLNNPQLFATLKESTLPRWKRLVVTELVNGNWLESRAGLPFFWMGQGDTVLQVQARRAGTMRVTATFEPGPSGPDKETRSVLVIADSGFKQVLTFAPGRQSFRVPVRRGRTTIALRPLDPQVHDQLPDRDWRRLIVGVGNLRVHFEKLRPGGGLGARAPSPPQGQRE